MGVGVGLGLGLGLGLGVRLGLGLGPGVGLGLGVAVGNGVVVAVGAADSSSARTPPVPEASGTAAVSTKPPVETTNPSETRKDTIRTTRAPAMAGVIVRLAVGPAETWIGAEGFVTIEPRR